MRTLKTLLIGLMLLSSAPALLAREQSVCSVFEDLPKSNGKELWISGDLVLSGDVTALTTTACDNEFVAAMYQWPRVVHLRPAPTLAAFKRQEFEEAAKRIAEIRGKKKTVRATATVFGRLNLRAQYHWGSTEEGTVGNGFGPKGSFPAELVFDNLRDIVIEELPSAAE